MPLNSLLRVFASKVKPSETKGIVRVGVIGAGRMGQYHARALRRLPGVRLVGIVDQEPSRSRRLARQCRSEAFAQAADLLGRAEAVVIATPTATHFSLGRLFLEAGIACLIEKPLTGTPEEAEALIALAEEKRAVLQVGHIERFNPAVMAAASFVQSPRFIEVSRLGPYDPRVAGIGVVMDLMIHDLDIVLFLVKSPVSRVEAFGAKILSDHEDIAKVRLHFQNGCIADLSASRISLEKYRRIRIFQKDAYLSIDCANPQVKIYRKKGPTVRTLRDIEILKPKLMKQDPLTLELDHFMECIREGKTPLVSGPHGRDALQLAREVLANLKIDV